MTMATTSLTHPHCGDDLPKADPNYRMHGRVTDIIAEETSAGHPWASPDLLKNASQLVNSGLLDIHEKDFDNATWRSCILYEINRHLEETGGSP
jgi:hypothetical protein